MHKKDKIYCFSCSIRSKYKCKWFEKFNNLSVLIFRPKTPDAHYGHLINNRHDSNAESNSLPRNKKNAFVNTIVYAQYNTEQIFFLFKLLKALNLESFYSAYFMYYIHSIIHVKKSTYDAAKKCFLSVELSFCIGVIITVSNHRNLLLCSELFHYAAT